VSGASSALPFQGGDTPIQTQDLLPQRSHLFGEAAIMLCTISRRTSIQLGTSALNALVSKEISRYVIPQFRDRVLQLVDALYQVSS
jgi:hypothetical protein